jgi:pimeloyl-ACP methyl ester carboxylesterase
MGAWLIRKVARFGLLGLFILALVSSVLRLAAYLFRRLFLPSISLQGSSSKSCYFIGENDLLPRTSPLSILRPRGYAVSWGESNYFTMENGLRVHYTQMDLNPSCTKNVKERYVLMMVHGCDTSSALFRHTIPRLSRSIRRRFRSDESRCYRLLVIDLPGYGMSDRFECDAAWVLPQSSGEVESLFHSPALEERPISEQEAMERLHVAAIQQLSSTIHLSSHNDDSSTLRTDLIVIGHDYGKAGL